MLATNIVSPTAVVSQTGGTLIAGYEIIHTIDHSGLTSVFTSGDHYATYLALNPKHQDGGGEWYSSAGNASGIII